jgi:DNA transformation protein
MAVSGSYLDLVLGQLDGLRRLVTKRMFGGVGMYADGTFFAVIDNDTLFFKVDEVLAERHRARGMLPFAPIPGAKPMMSYYQVPVDVIEDAEELTRWAKDSIRTAAAAPPKRKRAALAKKPTAPAKNAASRRKAR